VDLGETPEETAQLLCECLLGFPEMDAVIVTHFPAGAGPAVVIGRIGEAGGLAGPAEALDDGVAAYLRERAAGGSWTDDPASGRWDARLDRSDMAGMAVVGAPIRHRGRVMGAVLAGTATASADSWAARYVRVVSELAAHLGPLLGPALGRRDSATTSVEAMRRVIDQRAFRPHFQPICDLETRIAVGWESFARFDDAVPPLRRFADARALGLGDDLEVACGEAATEAFAALGRDGWLSINVSPALVLGGRAERIVRAARARLVLELTEPVPAEDYPRLRGAIDRLGAPAMLAMDDSGTGRVGLREVLELRPDFVKLDPGMIHEIDLDTARQAMITAMVAYAAETRAMLIAEGIETEAERRMLLRLGVRLGQGNLLGAPSADGGLRAPRGAIVA
jgi:EAL domain-containing protein (putative c-di-GMP-specific phosphodiesterase class I)